MFVFIVGLIQMILFESPINQNSLVFSLNKVHRQTRKQSWEAFDSYTESFGSGAATMEDKMYLLEIPLRNY